MNSSLNVGQWFKSSYSQNDSDCVEVATDHVHVGVRDTKDRAAGKLTLPNNAWQTFINNVAD